MATVHVRDVPEEVHEDAKVEAARSGQSLRGFVVEALIRETARRQALTPEQRQAEREERKRREVETGESWLDGDGA